MVIGSLALLLAVLGSSILEPDLDLTVGKTDGDGQLSLALDRYVLVVEKLLLQLHLLQLRIDDPVFVLCTRLT